MLADHHGWATAEAYERDPIEDDLSPAGAIQVALTKTRYTKCIQVVYFFCTFQNNCTFSVYKKVHVLTCAKNVYVDEIQKTYIKNCTN